MSGTVCSVVGCQNSNRRKGCSMFTITAKRRSLGWLKVLQLPETTPRNAKICEGHFTKESFEVVDNVGNVRLKTDAVPSIIIANPENVTSTHVAKGFRVAGLDQNGAYVMYNMFEKRVRALKKPEEPA